jgi:hypothetical protein
MGDEGIDFAYKITQYPYRKAYHIVTDISDILACATCTSHSGSNKNFVKSGTNFLPRAE